MPFIQGTDRPPQPGKSIRTTLDKTPTPSSGNFYFSNSKFVSINTFLQEKLGGYIQITERKKARHLSIFSPASPFFGIKEKLFQSKKNLR